MICEGSHRPGIVDERNPRRIMCTHCTAVRNRIGRHIRLPRHTRPDTDQD